VDRHAIRINLGYGVIELQNPAKLRADKLCILLTDAYRRITKEDSLSAVTLNDGYWAIGSRICRYNDSIQCAVTCAVNCKKRPESNQNATWFYSETDKRRNPDNLFSYTKTSS
jgi:hypothetical protein